MPDLPTRNEVRDALRRYRRPLAAASAAAAVLVGLGAVAQPTPAATPTRPHWVPDGTLAMPVTLALSGAHLTSGSVIDVVAMPDDGAPWVVTRDTVVLEVSATSALSASSDASVLLAVSEDEGLSLAQAGARGGLTALIHADGR